MPMDIDYIVAKESIDELHKLLLDTPHGEREEISDELIVFVEKMKEKLTKYYSQDE
jgi:hypothetical protein